MLRSDRIRSRELASETFVVEDGFRPDFGALPSNFTMPPPSASPSGVEGAQPKALRWKNNAFSQSMIWIFAQEIIVRHLSHDPPARCASTLNL